MASLTDRDRRCTATHASTGERCKRKQVRGGKCSVHAGKIGAEEKQAAREALKPPKSLSELVDVCAWAIVESCGDRSWQSVPVLMRLQREMVDALNTANERPMSAERLRALEVALEAASAGAETLAASDAAVAS